MAGYRCVNFHDLCRLCCSSSASGATNNVQIYATEGLQKKIMDCLSITLSENDKLPKTICSTCKEYIDVFSEFRKSSKNAQKMLEGCLNTSKLRNGGQVYIKDETPVKKVLKPIQNSSPTKIIPNLNLCNIITTAATPTKQIKKNVITSPNQPQDLISSIMQAVGIQAGEEATDNCANNNVTMSQQNIQPQAFPILPQYTLTLDGNTLKTGQIQYKIENAGNLLSQHTPLLAAKNFQDIQNQQVDEFLKQKQKSLVVKRDNKNTPLTLTTTTATQSQSDEPIDKKPKFNLILQTTKPTPAKIQQPQIVSPQPKTSTTSPNKAHILNIEKILPITHQSSPTKQLVVPIMVRNSDGSTNTIMAGNDVASQVLSKAFSMTAAATNQGLENKIQPTQQQQPVVVQMKLQPNADGQLTLTPVQQPQQSLQLALSPQQLQQLNFQAIPQQTQSALNMNPTQLTVQQVNPAAITTTTAQDIQTQTMATSIDSQDKTDDDIDENNDTFDDDYYPADEDEETAENESQEKQPIKKVSPSKKTTKTIKPSKTKSKASSENSLTDLQSVNVEHSDMAKKQLNQLTNYTNKRTEAESSTNSSEINLTVCDVCKKIFKRKEFLMQHLKSHIGLRPFKCTEATCNKAFSRKEHLLRHISSHTGTKEFVCNVCNKFFSRKDNLNKHRRIHPETNQQGVRHNCQNCGKQFPIRSQLIKHQATCDTKVLKDDDEDEKELKSKTTTNVVKKMKIKNDKKQEQVQSVTLQQQSSSQQQQSQPKVVQLLQQPQLTMKTEGQGQTQQLITLSMSQAQSIFSSQQQSKAIYTLPTNFILNSNATFMPATNNELN
ncbi:hypothetical protein PVAND_011300 [Polypedilum vanderplanki]|uniref:Zinc finger protein n=1 Tax=Polypedilum vanderplanki TaxID=319348 RepID=A0A9J6CJY9_POLVA|nr:hypothetical protein PVAND_011300 [Polypedilum vanderplanki]